MRITALERQVRGKGVNLHLEHAFALALSPDICVRFSLRVGGELSAQRVAEIRQSQARHAALQSALRLLAYRPRSEAELRSRLLRRGVVADVVEETVSRLRELRLLDDESFARFLVDSRDRTSPRGRRLIASELRAKGIDRAVATRSVATLVDEDAAYRAAARRASSLAALPYADFRRRLTDFLLRRGFDHETSRVVTARTWEEAGHACPRNDDDDAALL